MLSHDQAEAALQQYAAPPETVKQGPRVHRRFAPKLAHRVVDALDPRSDAWAEVAATLDELDLAALEKVLTAITPPLGKDLAYWWQWSVRQPYQRGWRRGGFRSAHPRDSRAVRWNELRRLLEHATQYPQPLAWHADWLSHLPQYLPLAPVLASAIDRGNNTITECLLASIHATHPISAPSYAAYVALMASSDTGAWATVERALIHAQRAEGLRQTIMEAADLAHPDVFVRLVDVVLEHGLTRFAAVVRAFGAWIGEELDVRQEDAVVRNLTTIRDQFRSPSAPTDLMRAEPQTAFLGLWCLAVRDAHAAVRAAETVLGSPDERVRLAAARVLAATQIDAGLSGLTRALADSSEAVYAAAAQVWPSRRYGRYHSGLLALPEPAKSILWQRIGELGPVHEVETGLIGSKPVKIGGSLAADTLIAHIDGPISPELAAAASVTGREMAVRQYATDPPRHRAALFNLVLDRSSFVRSTAGQALQTLPAITGTEAERLEQALSRKSADLRTIALAMLLKQDAPALAASRARLADGNAEQRRAADELAGRAEPADEKPTQASLLPAAAERTPAERPSAPPPEGWQRYHDGIRLMWTSLNAWLAEHADVEVRHRGSVSLLADLDGVGGAPAGELPIPQILEPWWEQMQPHLTDGGVEAALAMYLPRSKVRGGKPAWSEGYWALEVARTVAGPIADDIVNASAHLPFSIIEAVAQWAWRDSWHEPVVQLLEAVAMALPTDQLAGPNAVMRKRGRRPVGNSYGFSEYSEARADFAELFIRLPKVIHVPGLTDDQLNRVWRALRFVDEPEGTLDPAVVLPVDEVDAGRAIGKVRTVRDQPDRWPVPVRILTEAFTRGTAGEADLMDALLVPPAATRWRGHDSAMHELTAAHPAPWASDERIQSVVDHLRSAVVRAECERGDLPTELSDIAAQLRSVKGAGQLVRCLKALGARPFARGYLWNDSRESSLSRLILVSYPLPRDDSQTLGKHLAGTGISEHRLVETAVYAPQWARIIADHLGWAGLESAVWWIHSHTKDQGWTDEQWARISQWTALDQATLSAGGADVDWFRRMVEALGQERFAQVLKAAKYASTSGAHKRAELFAQALQGRIDEAELRTQIEEKRRQDAVRALGLLPVPDRTTLLERYELLRGFVASDRTSGSQRRASETEASDVGLENLARAAGYRDPQRLIWAMEADAVRDLAEAAVTARDGDLEVSLSLDEAGTPVIAVNRGDKRLKSIPAKSAKQPQIAALRDRASLLRKQIRRMRASLEAACVLGDPFDAEELDQLLQHPILAPMLRDLVLTDDEGICGFPLEGATLIGPDGERRSASGKVKVAHPVDLLASGEWPSFQHALMSAQRRQPFKQLFRELYTLNEGERAEDGVGSRRYAGHQVEARRASGLFTARGWVADSWDGYTRTFHQQQITAWCTLGGAWASPTEAEDPTLDTVVFRQAGQWLPLPLHDVPARVFSETMRDLDLVVSVAHSSGVDPETSESSIMVRARLVEETADLLGLRNVEAAGHHARIKGKLGTYSVHLGSGVVHRTPGNAVCIVPVSAQHRGRIFLPFTDDDPRTAEIVAKVVLLARDDKIKDPTIVEQLVR